MGFIFGVIFAKKTKTQILPPRENFHVYSISAGSEICYMYLLPLLHDTKYATLEMLPFLLKITEISRKGTKLIWKVNLVEKKFGIIE